MSNDDMPVGWEAAAFAGLAENPAFAADQKALAAEAQRRQEELLACTACGVDQSALTQKDEELRELRSYCVTQEELMLGHFNPPSASEVYGKVATLLAEILDGEK